MTNNPTNAVGDLVTVPRNALSRALNFIENTEIEMGEPLGCGDALRAALAASPAHATGAMREAADLHRQFRGDLDHYIHCSDNGLSTVTRDFLIRVRERDEALTRLYADASRAAALSPPAPEGEAAPVRAEADGEPRNDYITDAQARELFGEDDDEPLPEGRVRVCDGEWVRIPGGYYFDKSAGPLHPETTSEACDQCAVTISKPEGETGPAVATPAHTVADGLCALRDIAAQLGSEGDEDSEKCILECVETVEEALTVPSPSERDQHQGETLTVWAEPNWREELVKEGTLLAYDKPAQNWFVPLPIALPPEPLPVADKREGGR